MTALTSRQAAERLGVGKNHISYLLANGQLEGTKNESGYWRITAESVERQVAERSAWVSYVEAAKMAGVAPTTVTAAVNRGDLIRRDVAQHLPSILRSSVGEWIAKREAEAEKRADVARERALAYAETLPPASDHDWLTGAQAAEILGVTKNRVSQLALADRVPHVRKGRRTWFRRDLLEMIANARDRLV